MWKGTVNLLKEGEPRAASDRDANEQPHELPPIPMPPPGRLTRKARAYEAQIAQLRSQGYTLNAIRQGLEAVGIKVSVSTIHREVRRADSRSASSSLRTAMSPPASPLEAATVPPRIVDGPSAPVRTSSYPSLASQVSGKDLAEAFAQSRSDNPLVRAKELP